jgi:lysophospholipase L1-like esterase
MKSILVIITSLFLLTSCGSPVPEPIVIPEKTEKTILALGDSLTTGYGLPISDAYPSQLEAKLREKSYNYRIINA